MILIRILLIVIAVGIHASDLDLLYDDSEVAIIEIEMSAVDLTWMYDHVQSDSLHPVTVHFSNAFINESVENVGFRIRGNTSREAAKKSFKLSFNSLVPGRQFYGIEKMNLNGEHNDPSIMRSKLAWDLYQKTGLETSRAAHCALYINGVYYGLYISIEHIDDEFIEQHFGDDSGNLWKCLWPADLTYRGPDAEDYHPYQDATRPYELKTNRDEYDYSALAHLITIINTIPPASFADSLEQVLLVPEVLKYAAMNVITGNWDDYWFLRNNYYLYHEPGIDRFHWIPYDYDNNFGIDWFGVDWTQVEPYGFLTIEETWGQGPGPRPLMENIMSHDAYRDLYTHFIDYFMNNITDLSHWESRVDSLKDMITPWALADTFRTQDYGFSIPDFYESYTPNTYNNQHVKKGLKEFAIQRHQSLASQLDWENARPIVYDIKFEPMIPGPLDSIHVTVSAYSHVGLDELTIAFHPGDLTVIESYPMRLAPVIGSTIVEEADRWVGVIPPLGELGFGRFQVEASDLSGRSSLYPRGHFLEIETVTPSGSVLLINEFLARNDSLIPDPAGEFDDWLEIYNASDTDIYLSGMYLTDNPANLTKWQFPFGGVVLAARDFLVVWCDEDQSQDGVHCSFKLNGDGEFLALVDVDGETILDGLNFGPQLSNVSYGRTPDGGEDWTSLPVPTPGSSNVSSSVDPGTLPATFQLSNFPNPFNGQTHIRFRIAQGGETRVLIHDLQGKQVTELINRHLGVGIHGAVWDARDNQGREVPAGIYILTVQQASQARSHKLVLIK